MDAMIPFSNTRSYTGSAILPSTAGISPAGDLGSSAAGRTDAKLKLVRRVYTRCGEFIQEACRSSSVRPEFLGALTANESGGDIAAVRFERLCRWLVTPSPRFSRLPRLWPFKVSMILVGRGEGPLSGCQAILARLKLPIPTAPTAPTSRAAG
jgi:hypothetical protein